MRSSKSRFVGLFAGVALCAGVLAAAPARAQLLPEAGYEAGAEVYAAPEDPSVEVQGYAQPQPDYPTAAYPQVLPQQPGWSSPRAFRSSRTTRSQPSSIRMPPSTCRGRSPRSN